MTFNPQTHEDYDRIKGFDVYSADDEKIGTIDQVLHPADEMPKARGHHVFLVKPGTLGSLAGADDMYVPENAIKMVGEDRVILETTKDRMNSMDWSQPPPNTRNFRRS